MTRDRASLGFGALASYGALRAPLALLELPLFVLLPPFYAGSTALPLALIGLILLVTRLGDALLDPFIGLQLDRASRAAPWRRFIFAGLPVMAIGFYCLLNPPAPSASRLAAGLWLGGFSIVVYVAYSYVSIAYQSWGASLGETEHERVKVTATREAFGLAGVVLASSLLTPSSTGPLTLAFAVTAIAATLALRFAPSGTPVAPSGTPVAADRPIAVAAALAVASAGPAPIGGGDAAPAWFAGIGRALSDRPFRWLVAAFALNGIAAAIPATLALFFIGDVLQAGAQAPTFLLVYFLGAALAMPFWTWVAARTGLRNAWILGIAMSVAGFVWTLGLGPGDTVAFAVICAITGFGLAADLAIPPAMLAALVDTQRRADAPPRATCFGLWNTVTKLNLAIAAGVGLPLLDAFGYVPGAVGGGSPIGGAFALTMTYAGLPCLLKIGAAILLLLNPAATPTLRTSIR